MFCLKFISKLDTILFEPEGYAMEVRVNDSVEILMTENIDFLFKTIDGYYEFRAEDGLYEVKVNGVEAYSVE